MNSLSTPFNSKGKRQKKAPFYFKTRRSTRIKQGKPQTPTKTEIIVEDSPKEKEKIFSL